MVEVEAEARQVGRLPAMLVALLSMAVVAEVAVVPLILVMLYWLVPQEVLPPEQRRAVVALVVGPVLLVLQVLQVAHMLVVVAVAVAAMMLAQAVLEVLVAHPVAVEVAEEEERLLAVLERLEVGAK